MNNKKAKKSIIVAALLASVLLMSVVAYAASPAIWRALDTKVLEGNEFVHDFVIEVSDDAMSGGLNLDREAYDAAGGGAIIVDVEGETQVLLDELVFDNLEDALKLFNGDVLLPTILPEGYNFSKATFPVNPLIHEYLGGEIGGRIPADQFLIIHYSDGDDIIELRILPWSEDVSVSDVFVSLPNTDYYSKDFTIGEYSAKITAGDNGVTAFSMVANGMGYSFLVENKTVTPDDLITAAESMK